MGGTYKHSKKNGGTRRVKRGSGGVKKTFNTTHELTKYLEKNYHWMKRVNVYTKEDFKKRLPAKYEFVKYEFPHLYQIGNLKEYVYRIF